MGRRVRQKRHTKTSEKTHTRRFIQNIVSINLGLVLLRVVKFVHYELMSNEFPLNDKEV